MAGEYPANWSAISARVKREAGGKCVRCKREHNVETGYMLTVHHLDMDKANCKWWNLVALCQRCHLKIQVKVDMNQLIMFGHSEWIKPHILGAVYQYDHEACRAFVAGDNWEEWRAAFSIYSARQAQWPRDSAKIGEPNGDA